MLRPETEHKLARFLKAISNVEVSTEQNRIDLAKNPDFDAYSAFYSLDSYRSGYVTQADLHDFLLSHKLSPTQQDIDLVIETFDKNRDGKLSYSEFLNIVLPADAELRRQATQKSYGPPYSPIFVPKNVMLELGLLFESEINGLKMINVLRQELLESYDWSLKAAFRTIDTDDVGSIDRSSLVAFFRRNNIGATREEVSAVLRRLDKDSDGRWIFAEFAEAFHPDGKFGNEDIIGRLSATERLSQRSRSSSPGRRTNRSRSPEGSIRKKQYIDEIVKDAFIGGQGPKASSRSHEARQELDRIAQMVDQCLQKSLENRTRSKLASHRNSRSPSPLRSSLKTSRSPRSHRSHRGYLPYENIEVKPYPTPELPVHVLTSSRYFSPEKRVEQQRYSPKSTIYLPTKESQIPTARLTTQELLRSADRQGSPGRLDSDRLDSLSKRSRIPREVNPIEFDYTKIPYNKPLLDSIVDRAIQKAREARSRSPLNVPRKPPLSNTIERRYEPLPVRTRSPEREEPLARSNIRDSKIQERPRVEYDNFTSPTTRYRTPPRSRRSGGDDEEEFDFRANSSKTKESETKKLSPMKAQEELTLLKALEEIMAVDRAVEDVRERLALQSDYTPLLVYHNLLDPDTTNKCDMRKFEEVLATTKLQLSRSELQAVFKRFDQDGDGTISEKDFEEMIYPKDRTLTKRVGRREDTKELSQRTLELVNNFFKAVIESERKVEEIRGRLSKRSLFEIEEAFKALDTKNKGFISADDFQELFYKHYITVTAKQLENLIHRYDTDFDGKITLKDLREGLLPQ